MYRRQATRRCQAIFFVVLAIAPVPAAFGLDPKQPINSYLRTQFTMSDGLPSDIINGLAQAGGFLWIATAHVLARLDEWHFAQIGLDASLAYNTLATGPGGDLWIGDANRRHAFLTALGPAWSLHVSLFPGPAVRGSCQSWEAGYLLKSSIGQDLPAMIRSVSQGNRCLPPEIAMEIAEHVEQDDISHREVEVLKLVAAGLANKEIAARLGLTEETVKSHMRNIMEKLQANDRTHAVMIAVRRGVIPI